eukprot:4917998-Pyramimonas_sp.AAC.1
MPQLREVGLRLQQRCPRGVAHLAVVIAVLAQHRGGSRQRVIDRLPSPWAEGLSSRGAEEHLRLNCMQT